VSFGTKEETPGKHFYFKSRANWLLTSVAKHQLSIFEETSIKFVDSTFFSLKLPIVKSFIRNQLTACWSICLNAGGLI